MKKTGKSILFRILKISGITIASILILLFVLPFLFPKTIAKTAKNWINHSVTSSVEFSNARFTFFKHFPSLTFTLEDVVIIGSQPFEKDTLIAGKELSLGVNLLSLLSTNINVNQIFLSDAKINILVDTAGNGNYNIYRSKGNDSDTSSTGIGVNLDNIVIKNINLTYKDLSVPVSVFADKLNYKGSGDLSEAVFDMDTRLSAESFTLTYDGQTYVNKKQIKAKLLMAINTKSLSLTFQDNRVKINNLPVHFMGKLDFLDRGYNIDLQVESRKATLENIISAIPAEMASWSKRTRLKGKAVFKIQLKGSYDAATNQRPDFLLNLDIHNGYINYRGARQPLKNLELKVDARLPSLNNDSLDIRLDSLYFTVGKGFFQMRSHSIGLDYPYLDSRVKADLDLGAWSEALGLTDLALGGNYKLDFNAKGKYSKGQDPKSIRRKIIVTSIPSFSLASELNKGYLKFASASESIQNINFKINSSCPDNDLRHTVLKIDQIHLEAMKNVFTGHLKLTNLQTPIVDANLKGDVNLGEIAKFFPMGDTRLSGSMSVDAKMEGSYDLYKKMFPVTNVRLAVTNGRIVTGYYPSPIENIRILADLINKDGKLQSTTINIQPISFNFEGQPFMLKADLTDPDNISYDIVSKGTLDIGKLYRVFGTPEYDVTGFIKTDLALKGKESDVSAGRYQLLENSGTMELKDIRLRSELFPKPFMIHTGDFRFQQDKMRFDTFESSYGDERFTLNGYLQNVINYAVNPDGVLKGKFSLSADKINLKEFTAFGDADNDIIREGTDSAGSGVILIPKNLSVLFTAKVGEADYDGVAVNDFNGQLFVEDGKMKLQKTKFKLAGATFDMDATYEGVTAHKGLFDFKVKADSFSIAKAYQDIPMFREMVSSASGVQGIVGLDYELSGRLDQNMMPVYPSLKGWGVIHLKNVKLKGFKMMEAVRKSTSRDELKDPDLSGINLKTTVKNNIITLERVKLRILGFRPRFEGQVSLDGDLNIKGRLGLPPFGIFGIPFNVSGTSDTPIVKLKRDKEGNVLEEKEDVEEEEGDDIPVQENQN